MARDYFINGESMVYVKSTLIGSVQTLGLSDSSIRITPNFSHKDIIVAGAYGTDIPPEVQFMLADVTISMTLVHFDKTILQQCLSESMISAVDGTLPRAGTRMGGGVAFGASGNHYIRLGISSPVGSLPWVFKHTYMTGPPLMFPVGTERTIAQLNWRGIPYITDPWNSGNGSLNQVLWDHSDPTQM